jgi:hypothetical protein
MLSIPVRYCSCMLSPRLGWGRRGLDTVALLLQHPARAGSGWLAGLLAGWWWWWWWRWWWWWWWWCAHLLARGRLAPLVSATIVAASDCVLLAAAAAAAVVVVADAAAAGDCVLLPSPAGLCWPRPETLLSNRQFVFSPEEYAITGLDGNSTAMTLRQLM